MLAIRGSVKRCFLDVEDEIAASAQAVEVLAARHAREERIVLLREDRGAARADARGRRARSRRRR